MAEKTLQTRIINKHASLATWGSSSLVLKEGEIALAYIETTKPDGHGGEYTIPTYLMKVGDGTHQFKDLSFLAAPASDVYAWAKKSNLDLNDIPKLDAAHIPDLAVSKITGLETRLSSLETAVGTGGSVDTKIQNAINALDVSASTAADGVVIASISETDGKISVTRRALAASDIPELAISKIANLQTSLDAKLASATYTADKAVIDKGIKDNADAIIILNGEESTAGSVKAIAKSYADGKDASIKAAKDAADAAQSDVDTLEEAVNKLKSDIGNLSNIMNFRGAVASTSSITNPVEGDVIAVTAGENAGKEFIYSSGAWVEFGSVSAQDAAISALKDRLDVVQGADTVDGSIAKALKDAKNYADQSEADAISAVQGTASDTKDSATVAGAKKYADSKVNELANGQVKTNTSNITKIDGRVSSIEGNYVKISNNNLVDQSGDVIIFDCGGAE